MKAGAGGKPRAGLDLRLRRSDGRVMNRLLLGASVLALSTFLGCASSSSQSSGGSGDKAPIQDIEGSLQQLNAEVRALADSISDPASANDPKTARGRWKEEEQRLNAKGDVLKTRIRTLFGMEASSDSAEKAPPPASTSTAAEISPERRDAMMKELEETEAKLEEIRKKIAEDEAKEGAPK